MVAQISMGANGIVASENQKNIFISQGAREENVQVMENGGCCYRPNIEQ